MINNFDVIVIGAGAAGCFAAVQLIEKNKKLSILILEKGIHPLAKVKISGGGRCNVTNTCSEPKELSLNYPRGKNFLKKAFYSFSSNDMVDWLNGKGIALKEYDNGCLFPETNDSQTIIDCFLGILSKHKIQIKTKSKVECLSYISKKSIWEINTAEQKYSAKSVLVATGGQPKLTGLDWLKNTKINLVDSVPSLFTFNLPKHSICDLMGIVQENVFVRLEGEKWSSDGPLLITHWGMSGPAILKCSAYGARILADKNYNTTFFVNWTGTERGEAKLKLTDLHSSQRKLINTPLFGIKSRLWEYLIERFGISKEAKWCELNEKGMEKLLEKLLNDPYVMQGKTTFKEEFVTAGGVNLSDIEAKNMQHKLHNGLFFAGEVLDLDGITGGYNFQSAWTTAFLAANGIQSYLDSFSS